MRGKKRIAAAALTVLIWTLGFAAAGCGDGGGKTLAVASQGYDKINPALFEQDDVDSLIFSGLTAHDEEGKVVAALAESWDFSGTDNVYTFHLRDDVKWHDGEPFTSEDVRFTIDAILDPQNGSELASNFEDVIGVEAADPQTVRIAVVSPNTALLDYLSVGILPSHLLAGKNLLTDEFNQEPVGTGPYRFKKQEQDKSILLEKNENYFGGEPKIDKIILKACPDEEEREELLADGRLDLARISPKSMDRFSQSDSHRLYVMEAADCRAMAFNFKHPLFQENRELPRALSYAIDRQELVDRVLLGHGETAFSPLQKSAYVNPDMEKYQYDPARAAQLLEASGWAKDEDGFYEKAGKRLEFSIHVGKNDSLGRDLAQLCQAQMEALGVDVSVEMDGQIEWADRQAFLIGFGTPFNPDDPTYKVFCTGKEQNGGGYSNDRIDGLLSAARESDSQEEHAWLYNEFQTELAADPAMIFLTYPDAIYGASRSLSGPSDEMLLGHNGAGMFRNVVQWDITKKD